MAKKRKIKQKMVAKLPETDNLDSQYINPIKSYKDYTFDNIKSVILNSRYAQFLIILVLAGFFLRFYHLGWNSIWLDEASTVTFATAGSFLDIWKLSATIEPNPPLFIWIEYIVISIFGNNEFTLRFASAFFGSITIPVIYLIGKEFIDENGGLIAAAAFTISPFLIFYSQEARSYATLLFFISLSTLFYLKALKNEGLTYWILFATAASIAFWTHFYTSIFIGGLLIYTLIIYRFKYIKEMIASIVILAITSIPLAIVAIPVILKFTSGGPTFGVQGFGVVSQTLIELTGYNIMVTYIMLLLFICGLTALYIKEKEKSFFLLWMLGFTFAISFILSYKLSMVPRYLSFISIILVLGIASSYKLFYALTKQKAVVYILILGIIALNTPFLMVYYSTYTKDDWRGFSSTLSGMTQTGDSVIIVPGYMYQPLNYYYSNATDGTIEYLASNQSSLIAARSSQTQNSYYVVTGDIQSADPSGNSLKWINANTQQVYQNNNIYVFKS